MSVVIPRSVDDAVSALGDRPDAVVLAGGTDLMVEVNEAHRHVVGDETVVVVNRVPELRTWTLDRAAGTLRIGAAVTYGELASPPLAELVPALAQAARTVGSPQIRSAATVGGNLATVLAGRRRAAGARRARGARGAAQHRRGAHAPGGRVHGRGQAHGPSARRADHRGDGAAPRRLAGLRQGGRAQRDGHRHLGGVPRRRPADPLGAPGVGFGGADDRARATKRRRSPSAPWTGRTPRWRTRRSTSSAGSPPRPPARSTTTGRRRRTGATRSRCWPAACCAAPSQPMSAAVMRVVSPARQRGLPRRRRRVVGGEPAVRPARAPRPVRVEGRVRAGGVRVVQRPRRRRAGVLVPRAGGECRRPGDRHRRGDRRRRRRRRSPTCSRPSSMPGRCSAGSARRG